MKFWVEDSRGRRLALSGFRPGALEGEATQRPVVSGKA